MLDPSLSRLAVVAVCILISSLAYLPQLFLFQNLSQTTTLLFNTSVACIWISYFRSITTDAGSVPSTWEPSDANKKNMDAEEGRGRGEQRRLVAAHGRWCRKCDRWKPPRAHHCKTCRKCVVKMDHHCPWTNNCVGYANLPDFLRFLGFATFTTWWDWGLLAGDAWAIWGEREMPAVRFSLVCSCF
jgi:palmitoyltransferase